MDSSHFLLGGSPWLNLVNTRHMHNKRIRDVLAEPAAAQQWLNANQLYMAPGASAESEPLRKMIAELIPLRELCQEIVSDLQMRGKLSEDVLASLEKRTESLSIRAALLQTGEKISLTYAGNTDVDHVQYLIIRSIADTLEGYAPQRIRKCEHDECILHFVDTSKSGKRRWCSMEMCGNRHKAAEFYAKKKAKN
ncbi:CGNR zinc finger domain-containing protein [Paenibacillus beijingensis]|uniref:Zinc finger CGNR domain-containing protein n=1 Tax=Paenibacillus beijingensis TaxID=1126833 RepID=A0A0D5NI72_9BACL|nr:CGNR zinc finger domain-containing protein [Paenibacillus beijingensis]AJY74810.1 hypothetical protein VN24_09685 [Paenibacillus beijingensis]